MKTKFSVHATKTKNKQEKWRQLSNHQSPSLEQSSIDNRSQDDKRLWTKLSRKRKNDKPKIELPSDNGPNVSTALLPILDKIYWKKNPYQLGEISIRRYWCIQMIKNGWRKMAIVIREDAECQMKLYRMIKWKKNISEPETWSRDYWYTNIHRRKSTKVVSFQLVKLLL